ncbi:hypothetical protein KM043_018799 [Ampulex compressa]|nr:hypothetical protein KM043_018799 [Ampulex compressa]
MVEVVEQLAREKCGERPDSKVVSGWIRDDHSRPLSSRTTALWPRRDQSPRTMRQDLRECDRRSWSRDGPLQGTSVDIQGIRIESVRIKSGGENSERDNSKQTTIITYSMTEKETETMKVEDMVLAASRYRRSSVASIFSVNKLAETTSVRKREKKEEEEASDNTSPIAKLQDHAAVLEREITSLCLSPVKKV